MSRDCCVALPRGAIGLSAVCDCDISLSYSLFLTDHFAVAFVPENIALAYAVVAKNV